MIRGKYTKNENRLIDGCYHNYVEASLQNTIRFLEIGLIEILNELNDEELKKNISFNVREKIKTEYNIDKDSSNRFLRNLKTTNEKELNDIKYIFNAK